MHIKVCFRLGAGQTKAVSTAAGKERKHRKKAEREKKTWGKNSEQGKKKAKHEVVKKQMQIAEKQKFLEEQFQKKGKTIIEYLQIN